MNKNVYIKTLEAADVYSHMIRETDLKGKYVGMIPYSLELIKLKQVGLNISTNKKTDQQTSDDIINLEFNSGVKNGNSIKEYLNSKDIKIQKSIEVRDTKINNFSDSKYSVYTDKLKERNEKSKRYLKKLRDYYRQINNELDDLELSDKWNEKKITDLRHYLVENGFTITETHTYKTKNKEKRTTTKKIKYVCYKRSSAKSRTGQCLFIKEKLFEPMFKWSHMGLDFSNFNGDYTALLSYSALVSSSIETTIKIDPYRILLVSDIDSVFPWNVDLVGYNDQGKLDSMPKDNYSIKDSIFDGESLLDSKYYPDGKGFYLLRHHFFKSAAFNTNLQLFFKNYHNANKIPIPFEEWELTNMLGEPLKAVDCDMVITPNSLKAMKFSALKGSQKDMWHHWQSIVDENTKNGIPFGICKWEKPSKRGYDDNGNILNQTSYQYLNSLPITENEMVDLCSYETGYIKKLKTDNNFFLEYIKESATERNSNEMVYALSKQCPDFMNTDLFYSLKDTAIYNFVKHCKRGKIRLNGDYCIMLGNGIEYLYHAVGDSRIKDGDPENLSLKENQIYTPLFDDGDELCCFRSPHTSPSNCYLGINTKIKLIDRYFNLTDNLVYVNSIKFPIQQILSDSDYDSDSCAVFKNPILLNNVKRVFGKYRVCVNDVPRSDKVYDATLENMANIDDELSDSQDEIGETVNAGQKIMSAYWNKFNTQNIKDAELMKKVSIATVLSNIVIDSAKKSYRIDKKQSIKDLLNCSSGTFPKVMVYYHRKQSNGGEKIYGKSKDSMPNFFKYVSKSSNVEQYKTHYETAMDYLYDIFEECKSKTKRTRKKVPLLKLLNPHSTRNANYHQSKDIIECIQKMSNRLVKVYLQKPKNNKDRESFNKKKITVEDQIIRYFKNIIGKKNISEETMFVIIKYAIQAHLSNCLMRLLNVLYVYDHNKFLNCFSKFE